MKMRIKGNSLRLRISRSEMDQLTKEGRVEERIQFTQNASDSLVYAVVHDPASTNVRLDYSPASITVNIPTDTLAFWAHENQVGIYETLPLCPTISLDLIIEKDFPCANETEEENQDRFPVRTGVVAC